MNICPHCGVSVNPLRLLAMTRRSPYRCGKCGGRSLLPPKQNTVAALLTFGAAVGCVLFTPATFGIIKLVICLMALYVFVIGGTMWFFMKLERLKDDNAT
jgi:hypothetical protein